MKLDEPLLRLPLSFNAEALAAEVRAFPESAWVAHPNKLPGNEAVRLVTTNGEQTDDTASPMAPTQYLLSSPYIMEVMAAIGAVWGRSRLMRLAPGSVVPPHVDTHFYWRTHVRLHVPIVTTPDVLFTVGGQTVHMAAGECWVFDTFSRHDVRNGGTEPRVHLVLDTVGGEPLWDLIDEARRTPSAPPQATTPGLGLARPLTFERTGATGIMSPWELRHHVGFIAERAEPDPALGAVLKRLDRFVAGWTALWAQYANASRGAPAYHGLIAALEVDLVGLGGERLRLRNGLPVYRQVAELLFTLSAPLSADGQAHARQPITSQVPAMRSYAS